jgi:hypothetical protein
MQKVSRKKSRPSPKFVEEVRKVFEQMHVEGQLEIVGYRDGQPVYRLVDRTKSRKTTH